MRITTAIAIYILIWGTVIFAVLPWGIRSQQEHGEVAPGTEPGAPVVPGLGQKLAWNTAISTVIFVVFYFVYTNKLISLEDLATLWGLLPR